MKLWNASKNRILSKGLHNFFWGIQRGTKKFGPWAKTITYYEYFRCTKKELLILFFHLFYNALRINEYKHTILSFGNDIPYILCRDSASAFPSQYVAEFYGEITNEYYLYHCFHLIGSLASLSILSIC